MNNDDRKLSLAPSLDQVLKSLANSGTAAAKLAAEILERETRNKTSLSVRREQWERDAAVREGILKSLSFPTQGKDILRLWEKRYGALYADLVYSNFSEHFLLRVRVKNEPTAKIPNQFIGSRRFTRVPSRSHIRMAVRSILGAQLRPNAKRHGALVGVKSLQMLRDGRLASPQQHTPWEGNTLESDIVPASNNTNGIYALWPRRDRILKVRQEIEPYFGATSCVLVELLAQGVIVVGEKGWRAQKCIVTRICIGESMKHMFSLAQERYLPMGVRVEKTQLTPEEVLEKLHEDYGYR